MKEASNLTQVVSNKVELGTKKSMSVGRNKSGKPWKKESQRAAVQKPQVKIAFDIKKKKYEEMKLLRQRVAEKKIQRFDERKAQAMRTKEKQERKKLNEMKSSQYQIVSICKIHPSIYMNR